MIESFLAIDVLCIAAFYIVTSAQGSEGNSMLGNGSVAAIVVIFLAIIPGLFAYYAKLAIDGVKNVRKRSLTLKSENIFKVKSAKCCL